MTKKKSTTKKTPKNKKAPKYRLPDIKRTDLKSKKKQNQYSKNVYKGLHLSTLHEMWKKETGQYVYIGTMLEKFGNNRQKLRKYYIEQMRAPRIAKPHGELPVPQIDGYTY